MSAEPVDRERGAPAEALIAGGGPAGVAAACRLARAGRRVVLIEREAGPHHKVCGEFLSVEAAADLRELGLDLPALGAVPVRSLRLIRGERAAETRLPFPAWSLSRHVLDESLLCRAASLGAEIRRGVAVRGLAPAGEGWAAVVSGGEPVAAGAVFLATGKHDLRSHRRPPGRRNDLIGFKMHFRLGAGAGQGLAARVDVILFPGGYAGFQPVEGAKANLCLLVERRRFERLDGNWPRLLEHVVGSSAILRAALAGAEPCWPRPLAVYAIPYGLLYRAQAEEASGLFRLGDQCAVIPSFCGDGVAIALHTARLAAEAFLASGAAGSRTYHAAAQAGLARQIGTASLLQELVLRPRLQAAAVAASRLLPGLMRVAALRTRVAIEASGNVGGTT